MYSAALAARAGLSWIYIAKLEGGARRAPSLPTLERIARALKVSVRIELVGVSLAVKDSDAVLVTGLHALSVECLPADLPDHVTVDIAPLVKVGDSIHVRDVTLGDKVQILDDPDEMIVNATYAKIEVEAPTAAVEGAVAPEAEAAEPELSVERGKKEEEVEGEEKEKKK